MLKVLQSTVINHTVDAVWDLARDFNAHDQWHPAVTKSQIERNESVERVGCVRRFVLADGSELREQLLTLSDLEMSYSYCLLDTPIPLFNYVAHFRVLPVTDSDRAFCEWEASFNTLSGQEGAMQTLVREGIFQTGFHAMSNYLDQARS